MINGRNGSAWDRNGVLISCHADGYVRDRKAFHLL